MKNVVVSLQKRQSCCANSFKGCKLIHEPRTVADFITNKALLPVGTTRD